MHERKCITRYYLKRTNETSAINIGYILVSIPDIHMINRINCLFTTSFPSSSDTLDVIECVCNGAGWRL